MRGSTLLFRPPETHRAWTVDAGRPAAVAHRPVDPNPRPAEASCV